MNESRICKNCRSSFVIAPEDFAFYERIKVPPPTWCPECRAVRRLTWRNERSLYKRPCFTGAGVSAEKVSMFAPETYITVYHRDFWWSDNWDQLATGKDYDFSKPFFSQFQELLISAPLPNLANTNVVNSEYGNHNEYCKNCWLVFASFTNENVSYAQGAVEVKDSMDLYTVERAEQVYEDVLCADINRVFFSNDVGQSLNSSFLYDCKNMADSLTCINLRNKANYIFNKPYSKEEYKKKLAELDLGSYQNLSRFKNQFREFISKHPRRFASINKSVNVTGDHIMNSKNAHHCFDVYDDVVDSKYVSHALTLRDSYDGYGFGANGELLYEGIDSGIDASRYKFTVYTHRCHNVGYTYCCHSSTYLFGCVGLRNKKYCILNKQYTKEEYERLVPEIIKHMNEMPYVDAKGRTYRYGEFFPPELSPFCYNETIAQEYFPLTKDEATNQGFTWKEPKEKRYNITKKSDDLPDHIKDVDDTILNEVIGCEHKGECNEQCSTAFRIIPQELEFYRKMNIPLPRLCPNCRHYQRLKQRNPLKLWHRKCTCRGRISANGVYQNIAQHFHKDNHCPNEFETSYAPNRPEIVYCENCYNSEVV